MSSLTSPWLRRILFSLVLLICACVTSGQVWAAQTLNVRFSWKLKSEYAPFYVAKEMGYYTREGLDVRLGEGAGAQAALGSLLQGQDDVVVLPGIYAVDAIRRGMPLKLIAIYQPVTPMAFASRPQKPVREPKDLVGKTIATSLGDTTTQFLKVLCNRNKIDCNTIHQVMTDSSSRLPLVVAGKADVAGIYYNWDLPLLEEHNTNVVTMDLAKYGVAVPGLAVVTSDKLLASKAPALREFLAAVGEAMTDCRRNPDKAAEQFLKNWSGGPGKNVVVKQVQVTMQYVTQYPNHPAGWIDPAVIDKSLAALKAGDSIPNSEPASHYYSDDLLPAKQ